MYVPVIDALTKTWPLYEGPVREGLSAWWSTDSVDAPRPARVSNRALLPAMGLGALAALSLYHRLAKNGVGPLVLPDPVPDTDPLRKHNPATTTPSAADNNHRLASIAFAVHAARSRPPVLRGIASNLNINLRPRSLLVSQADANDLLVAIIDRLFKELPPAGEMSHPDHLIFESRLKTVASAIFQAFHQADLPLLPQTTE